MPDFKLRLRAPASAAAHDPITGVIWITIAMALFGGLAVFSRMAMNAGLHPFAVVFLRNAFACLLLLPLLVYRGPSLLRSSNFGLYGVRVVVSLLSMQAWFYAISIITIGEVTAISFLAPLFGTLGAIFLLGEEVRLLAVLSAMFTGLTAVLVKQLTAHDDPDKIVFLTNMMLLPLSLVPALFVWTWPTAQVLPALIGMGVCAVLGHIALVRGYTVIDASLALTFEFSKLPFTVALAYLAFAETIDVWTWVGALVIFASAVYITRREAQLRRAAALSTANRR
jgi:drug/metabolite transporter (DMT)-like permease